MVNIKNNCSRAITVFLLCFMYSTKFIIFKSSLLLIPLFFLIITLLRACHQGIMNEYTELTAFNLSSTINKLAALL